MLGFVRFAEPSVENFEQGNHFGCFLSTQCKLVSFINPETQVDKSKICQVLRIGHCDEGGLGELLLVLLVPCK